MQVFEGSVVRRRVATGSKSEREAVVLATERGDFVLRRRGGNAFQDEVLNALVGHRIRGSGELAGYTFILTNWTDLDEVR
jgi:hypothetical protein